MRLFIILSLFLLNFDLTQAGVMYHNITNSTISKSKYVFSSSFLGNAANRGLRMALLKPKYNPTPIFNGVIIDNVTDNFGNSLIQKGTYIPVVLTTPTVNEMTDIDNYLPNINQYPNHELVFYETVNPLPKNSVNDTTNFTIEFDLPYSSSGQSDFGALWVSGRTDSTSGDTMISDLIVFDIPATNAVPLISYPALILLSIAFAGLGFFYLKTKVA